MLKCTPSVFAAMLLLASTVPVRSEDQAARANHWSGPYVGLQLGYNFTHVDYVHREDAPITEQSFTHSLDRLAVAGFAGWQHQWGRFVPGIEIAYAGPSDDDGKLIVPPGVGRTPRIRAVEVGPVFSVAGRLGYDLGSSLPYVKIGYATTHVDFTNTRPNGALLGASEDRVNGLLLGLGIDYKLSKDVTFGVVYDYISFDVADQVQMLNGAPAGATNIHIDADAHVVSARLAIKLRP